MRTRITGQSILEYVILLGIIAAALTAMSLYFRRSIQGVVKLAADQAGEQKNGGVDYDYKYDWKIKGESNVSSYTAGNKTTDIRRAGAVDYTTNETSAQNGTLSHGISYEK